MNGMTPCGQQECVGNTHDMEYLKIKEGSLPVKEHVSASMWSHKMPERQQQQQVPSRNSLFTVTRAKN